MTHYPDTCIHQPRGLCPSCKAEMSAQDYKDAKAPQSAVAFSCVGRWTGEPREAFGDRKNEKKSGPCNYAGGGLFQINPVTGSYEGSEHHCFAFAEGG